MNVTVHAGHAAQGQKFCGAAGHVNESTVAREIKDSVIDWLRKAGHTATDCTVDVGVSQSNIITKIKYKINNVKKADVNLSIHLNACVKVGTDGKTKGVECCVYAKGTPDYKLAESICKNISALGFTNRGVKLRTDLGVLKGINNGGKNVLIECFFCDDLDDVQRYYALKAERIGKAIAEAVIGKAIEQEEAETTVVKGVKVERTASDMAISGAYKTIKDCSLTETPNGKPVIKLGLNATVYYEGWHSGEYAFVGYNKKDGKYGQVGFIHGTMLKKM